MSGCGGCDGRCCATFVIAKYDKLAAEPEKVKDGAFILDMLVPLTPEEDMERRARFGIHDFVPDRHPDRRFTCRHWDEDTRLCTVYDERPAMCRDYPYERECDHGCGWAGGRDYRRKEATDGIQS